MGKSMGIQDGFLNQARKEGVAVTLHLVNGFQLKGLVKSFDNFTIVLDSMGKQQMIYKHAISTVTPARAINLMNEGTEKETEVANEAEAAPESEPAQVEATPEKKPVKKAAKKVIIA